MGTLYATNHLCAVIATEEIRLGSANGARRVSLRMARLARIPGVRFWLDSARLDAAPRIIVQRGGAFYTRKL